MQRILVTGGAGYIGSHTAKALARAGFEPVVLDNLSTGHRWAVKWGPLVDGDLADQDLVRRTIQEHDIEAVVHFAASADVGESVKHPRKYYRNNVVNTLNLLDAMLDCGVSRVVFSSTCATYGVLETIPVAEDHPQRPVSPYGESKLFVERALRSYSAAYGLHWVALRYFNAAGADPEGEVGSAIEPEIRLIPLVIQAALGQRPAIDIFGTDYPTPDGTCIRDYIHVSDLAEAHVAALRYLDAGGEGLALNLGTGQGFSVREVIEAVERIGGRPVPAHEVPRRPGDPPAVVADASRAQSVLAWQPRHSSLDEIVQSAWRWQSGRPPR